MECIKTRLQNDLLFFGIAIVNRINVLFSFASSAWISKYSPAHHKWRTRLACLLLMKVAALSLFLLWLVC